MFLDLLNNIAITTAFLFVAGKAFQNRPLNEDNTYKTKLMLGVGGGILGTLLMLNSIHPNETVIVDLRHLAMVLAGVFGGPLSAILSAVVIGVMRIGLYGISTASLVACAVTILSGVIMGLLSLIRLPKTLYRYLLLNAFGMLAFAATLFYLLKDTGLTTLVLSYFIPFAIGGNIFTYFLAETLKKANQNHRDIKYYKLLAENSSDLISTHFLDGRFKYVSPSSKAILGYEPDELIGKNPYDFYHWEDLERITDSHNTVKESSEESVVEYRFRKKDGSYVWLETTSKRMTDLGIEKNELICSSRDVDLRKDLESDLIEKNNRLKRLSNMDGLTEIFNRRYFDSMLEEEWAKAIHHKTPLTLIMFDIDYFKFYNDTYGHQQGDECIKEIANVGKTVLNRPHDLIARYGGEEFAVILPDTKENGALKVAEAIRKSVQVLAIPHVNSKVKPIVTVSVGVAVVEPTEDMNHLQLVVDADEALYTAKKNGRNQVHLYNDTDQSERVQGEETSVR
ncbi:diguanylate cyclase [Pseudalkalibacillus sp. Hm43]|uniref:diguanylate cyclase n=1 Tax=Pseudalkalibacillus sp. Hm43 TaxID=3450742 RepID=UPI003F43B0C9